ncbi:MAG: hypothetical protein FJY67_11025 [Calditrichaeota bacterium]|nr:hypothetical protein [Calditrichota bacterium]
MDCKEGRGEGIKGGKSNLMDSIDKIRKKGTGWSIFVTKLARLWMRLIAIAISGYALWLIAFESTHFAGDALAGFIASIAWPLLILVAFFMLEQEIRLLLEPGTLGSLLDKYRGNSAPEDAKTGPTRSGKKVTE